ncbi:UDP-glucose dehydrogenase family protein [Salinibacter ruber]|jgi:UDPglucose 6-dehydrogenase|uniref:UDP-glucose 6-dehydrogenase n=1 Tax=Salinibacter ruber TaxID=146919 RepID=A0A9X2ZVQ8_9BACT|nr:UDP-glucose/GDP-mannose dehydrogenase family protein [Salinibacter ruber]MCS3627593.1 UDPglucose 6-dehydrogenase [Salinibacter ruber]MCS3630179.1 UDPglucose 6-dehydrogenase [Salinibacter ruber]MCS3649711.1 UDPglucose 6-dehydrogenase [Salinibacter ruber]MCS3652965.1 UDPglucose 6-dehydrogenase [Salinibacter ruber]MCS3664287.1 UDPglucose 6-dehydrogenase [Salinibacter ruber]
MDITVIGTGYVGLVSGTCFAEMGHDVTCVDVDEEKVAQLSDGEIPIYEPDLDRYFERARAEDRLRFTTDLAEGIAGSKIVFFALPTPPGEDGSADLSYVLDAAGDVADLLVEADDPEHRIVVNKSTVPVGTGDRVEEAFADRGLDIGGEVDVVSNPEFLREGSAVDDFLKPDRVVIGTESDRAAETMRRLYEPFVRQGNPVLVVDRRSAEMIKYAANSLLATRISFMNEIANVCERVGANVDKVRLGISKDHRIGPHFLYAGIGFGGSCFPKDVQALARKGREKGYDFQILDAVLDVNDQQRRRLAEQVEDYFDGDLDGRRIAVWGLSFKPGTDDTREAPSHVIIDYLLERGADVVGYDPEAIETTKETFGDQIAYADGMYEAVEGAESLLICTEWHEFRRPDLGAVREHLENPLVLDGRNLYDPARMAEMGFEYHSIGRPSYAPETNQEAIEAAIVENGQP